MVPLTILHFSAAGLRLSDTGTTTSDQDAGHGSWNFDINKDNRIA
jgi:hypothetical protein